MAVGNISSSAYSSPGATSAGQPDLDALRSQLEAGLSPGQLQHLRTLFHHDVQQSFANNKSIDQIGSELSKRVSSALQKAGVSDDQQKSITDTLQGIFNAGGSKDSLRAKATSFLNSVADKLQSGTSAQASASNPEGTGQILDTVA